MLRHIALAAAMLLSIGVTATASAGPLGDFNDAVSPGGDGDESNDNGNDGSSSNRSGTQDDEGSNAYSNEGYHCSDVYGAGSCDDDHDDVFNFFAAMFTGYIPGSAFSYGPSPYAGRGLTRVGSNEYRQSSTGEVQQMQRPVDTGAPTRHGYLRLYSGYGALTQATASGFDMSARITSTFTPGLELGGWRLHDRDLNETSSHLNFSLTPRLWVDQSIEITMLLGYTQFGDGNSTLNQGALLGARFEILPFDPVVLDFAVRGHILGGGSSVLDASAAVSVLVAGPFGVFVSARSLGSRGTRLGVIQGGLTLIAGF